MPTTAAPKPDSRTGEPRPPSAPLLADWQEPKEHDLNGVKPWMKPPEGRGELLESFLVSTTAKRWTAFWGFLFVAIASTVFWGGFGWVQVWWLWLIVLAPIPIFLFQGKVGSAAAGADWLICSNGLINTYRLTKVRITNGVNTHFLDLADDDGNKASSQLWYWQKNPKLWDLVYNGILYSVANGAECNDKTRKFLHIYT